MKTRAINIATFAGVAAIAAANTKTAWSNPLLRDVPATAKGFISIDLAGTNKPLASVLKLVGGATGSGLEKSAAGALGLLNLPKSVQDAFTKSWNRRAVVYFDPSAAGGAMQQGVVLVVGLKAGNHMAAAMKTEMVHDIDGIAYADFKAVEAHIEGNALLLTQSPQNLPWAVKPFRGGAHLGAGRLSQLSDSIEPTAEIIGWLDSDTAMSASPGVKTDLGLATGKSFGLSLGLHPKGVSLAVGPLQFSTGGKSLNLSQFRPLPNRYPRTLPGGAYFLTCLANPWPLADKMGVTAKLPTEAKGMINEIKSAVRGNYVFGIYPTRMRKGAPEGVDLLVELRPNEGNNAAASLNKVMGMIKKALLPGDASVFEPFHIAGANHAYRLKKVVASLMRAGLKSSMNSIGGGADDLLRDKNLVFAGVGHKLLFATSEPVMRKAVAALKYGRSSLASDPKFSELAKDSIRPTHFVVAISLTRTVTFLTKALTSFSVLGHGLRPWHISVV